MGKPPKNPNSRILALFDTHIPYHIPLDPIFNFIEDWKPTKIILGGDMHDWSSVSQWLGDQSRALDGGTILDNYRELRTVLLDPLSKIARHSEIIYLTGNHEYWLQQAANINPNGRGYWNLDKNIGRTNVKIIPVNMPYRLNSNLVFIHGLYTCVYHAKKTVDAFHISVIYGHLHTFQSHTLVSPIDNEQFYTGQAIGCLCNLNPGYMKNRPNAWVNGFCYGYTGENDSFQYVPVVIVHNKFWAEGRRYK
jgi:predicted phosphodiesterase